MRKTWIIMMVLFASLAFAETIQKPKWTPQQKTEFLKIHQSLKPQLRAELAGAVNRFAQRYGPLNSQGDPEAIARQVVAGMNVEGLDLDSLIFYVMASAYRSADEDLRSLVDEMSKMNQAKQSLRDYIRKLNQMIQRCRNTRQWQTGAKSFQPVPRALSAPEDANACRPARTRNFRIQYCLAPEIEPPPDMTNWTNAQLQDRLELRRRQLRSVGSLIQHNGKILDDSMSNQARIINTMSNIMKVLHDVRSSSIRNMR